MVLLCLCWTLEQNEQPFAHRLYHWQQRHDPFNPPDLSRTPLSCSHKLPFLLLTWKRSKVKERQKGKAEWPQNRQKSGRKAWKTSKKNLSKAFFGPERKFAFLTANQSEGHHIIFSFISFFEFLGICDPFYDIFSIFISIIFDILDIEVK